MESKVLSELKNKFDLEQEIEFNNKVQEKLFYEQNGFKSWEELLSYIKEGHTIYNYCDSLSWNSKTNMVRYYLHGNGQQFYTEKEFLDWKHDVDNRYKESARNEYGYINGWTK